MNVTGNVGTVYATGRGGLSRIPCKGPSSPVETTLWGWGRLPPPALSDGLDHAMEPVLGDLGEPEHVLAQEVVHGEGRPLHVVFHEEGDGLLDGEGQLPHPVLAGEPA